MAQVPQSLCNNYGSLSLGHMWLVQCFLRQLVFLLCRSPKLFSGSYWSRFDKCNPSNLLALQLVDWKHWGTEVSKMDQLEVSGRCKLLTVCSRSWSWVDTSQVGSNHTHRLYQALVIYRSHTFDDLDFAMNKLEKRWFKDCLGMMEFLILRAKNSLSFAVHVFESSRVPLKCINPSSGLTRSSNFEVFSSLSFCNWFDAFKSLIIPIVQMMIRRIP